MYTETTRDKAMAAAAAGKTVFVITQKDGYPDIVNLTKLLGETLTEKGNIFIVDVGEPKMPEPIPQEMDTPPLKAKPRVIPAKHVSGISGHRSKVDDGKLTALFNAGWSHEKIAEEMNIGVSTVYKHLAHLREEGKLWQIRKPLKSSRRTAGVIPKICTPRP